MLALISVGLLGKILTFLVMLSVLVVLHEAGHFFAARRNGIRVLEFSVGMGPRLFSRASERSGTLYSLRALPIGGYCLMLGEDGGKADGAVPPESFPAATPWRRLAVIVAGPVMNFILAYVILLVGAVAFGVAGDRTAPVVGRVLPNTPAARIGLEPGDRIVRIDGIPITDAQEMLDRIHGALGRRIALAWVHDGMLVERTVVPQACPSAALRGEGCIGFEPLPVPLYQHVGPAQLIADVDREYATIAGQTIQSVVLLVTHFSRYAGDVSGPVGIAQAAVTVQSFGWGPYFTLAALLSFALGLFNLLPFPALDGGRGLFVVIELVRGKPIDPDKEAWVHMVGFAAVLALLAVVTLHDIARIASGRGIF
jgi:regulator of sigma E protease